MWNEKFQNRALAMWLGQKKDGKTGFGRIRVSEKLFVGVFSSAVALSVFKFGEKGFGTAPWYWGRDQTAGTPRQNTSPVKTPSAEHESVEFKILHSLKCLFLTGAPLKFTSMEKS